MDIIPIGRDGATNIAADGTRPGTELIRRLGVVARRSRQRVSRPDAGGALVREAPAPVADERLLEAFAANAKVE